MASRLLLKTERTAIPNYCRARIYPCITSREARVLHNGMGQECAARPSHLSVAIVLCQVEQAGLRGEDPQVDSRLRPGRRMAPKERVAFLSSAVKQLPRCDCVGCLGSSKQRHAGDKYSPVWLWRVRFS